MNTAIPRSLRLVKWANVALVVALCVLALGLAAPSTLGQLINPHSAIGVPGMTAVGLTLATAGPILIGSLPFAAVALVRNPLLRTSGSLAVVSVGAVVSVLLVGILLLPYV